jgi:hypothetical protein
MHKPQRVASWWSILEDLLWPEKEIREKITRRADALAAAQVDTVIQFGFHLRFDFAPYFGALHGYLAAVAEALHARGIQFVDHFSCNVVARPRDNARMWGYHEHERHHVALYPDAVAAETMSYAGYRYNDLREIDIETGQAVYCETYDSELFCHNNPDYLAMHEAYLRRLFADVPLDGLQQDDMTFYAYFRSCGCPYCRERFKNDYGYELPQITDKSFWGDTSQPAWEWGNYDNPVFRDWVQMRYRVTADHLAMVKRAIGPDKALMTCSALCGPMYMNPMGLSYELDIESCDWVMLENCGLDVGTTQWANMEPEALLHLAVARTKWINPVDGSRPFDFAQDGSSLKKKATPAMACSYTIFEAGAYLGWAIARFWGVANWISTLTGRLPDKPVDAKEEGALIAPYNNWEVANAPEPLGEGFPEIRVGFLRANRDNGVRDAEGREYWRHVERWCWALLERNIGYRLVVSKEMSDTESMTAEMTPLVVDSAACVSDAEATGIEAVLNNGGSVWIITPFGTHNADGSAREVSVLKKLQAKDWGGRLVVAKQETGTALLEEMIASGKLTPRVKVISDNHDWRVRLRQSGNGIVVQLLNGKLEGIKDEKYDVLRSINSSASSEPVVIEIDTTGIPIKDAATAKLRSPELESTPEVAMENRKDGKIRLAVDVSGFKVYGEVEL